MATRGECACQTCSVRGLGGSSWPGIDPSARLLDEDDEEGLPGLVGDAEGDPMVVGLGSSAWAGLDPSVQPAMLGPEVSSAVPLAGTSKQASSPKTVDIYLSAGEHRPDPETSYESCDSSHQGTCNLYRVRWNLRVGVAVSVTRLVEASGGRGWVQPAVSPGGRRLAYIGRTFNPGDRYPIDGELFVGNPLRGTPVSVDSGTGSPDRPQFPNWYTNDDVLYHKTDTSEVSTLWLAKLSSGSRTALLGPGGTYATSGSYQDANTAPDGVRIATFGELSDGNARPQTNEYDGGDYQETPTFGAEYGSGATIRSCHHPAWNWSGDRILCTNQSDFEELNDGSEQRLLYAYQWDGSAWVADGAVFEPPPEADLAAFLPKGSDTGTFARYTYKYAEWCVSDDYVIATLFADNGESSEEFSVVSSRVVVIKVGRSTRAVLGMWDITDAVEYAEGYSEGELRSVFATCAATRGVSA